MKEWTVEATVGNIPVITEKVETELEKLNCSGKAHRKINVALDELLNNIASYAYPQETGSVTVQMRYNEESETVSITLIDSGAAYNPLEKADPDVTLAAEERPIGGLGILMVKKKMDGMECRRENNHNILTIHKRIREE